MTQRITKHMLEQQVKFINSITESPQAPYARDENGKLCANPDNYHLDWAYSGVNLARMCNPGGGITCPLGPGYRTKRELFNEMSAFIYGLQS